jgi:hypothetical protein
VFELDYGNTEHKVCDKFDKKHKYYFYNEDFENYIFATNFIIEKALSLGYDIIFNVNMDDYYDCRRFEKQIKKIKEGYDLVSSNFYYIEETNNEDNDHVTLTMKMSNTGDVEENFKRGYNTIGHPCVCTSRKFWDDDLRYDCTMFAYEDFDLWKRALKKGKKLFILEDFLLYYRIHKNQVTKINEEESKNKKMSILDKVTEKIINFFK